MAVIMISLTYDYGGEEAFFPLLETILSKYDKLYIKESAPDCEHCSLKVNFTEQTAPLKNVKLRSVAF